MSPSRTSDDVRLRAAATEERCAFPIDKAPQTVVMQTAGRRTFRRRRRHKAIGDFSAQCLTDAAKRGYSACAALRFSGRARQFEACQPGGNGTNDQAASLSLAACGGSCGVVTIGAGGATRTARRRRAHCKFIVVVPPQNQLLPNVRQLAKFSMEITVRQNGAAVLKSHAVYKNMRRLSMDRGNPSQEVRLTG